MKVVGLFLKSCFFNKEETKTLEARYLLCQLSIYTCSVWVDSFDCSPKVNNNLDKLLKFLNLNEGYVGDSLTKPRIWGDQPAGKVAIICPDICMSVYRVA